ncbi:MAG: S41 family peptidase [Phycisphaeraceae bacterium]|nr:MAG: S41 family peptidase [Phycisphaeraceae bacterium]
MTSVRHVWSFAVAALLALSGLLGLSMATASDRGTATASSERIAAWSERVWTSATLGDGDRVLELLGDLPEGIEPATVQALMNGVDRFRSRMDERESVRETRLTEVRGEIRESLEKNGYAEALRIVLEWSALVTDDQGAISPILDEPLVADVIRRSRDGAARAEADGDWLEAYTLYNRLNLLHDPDERFKEDERRLWTRITLMRLYVPDRLHEMRSARRVAEGESALPPYNSTGEDWRQRWAGIDDRMVINALGRAARDHVERVPVLTILQGGLNRVRTFVTTSDLSGALPSLGDERAVQRFVRELDEIDAVLEAQGNRLGNYDIVNTVSRILRANRDTIRVADEAILHEFGTGAAAATDEFTAFYWPDELANFQRTAEGNFTGVGIQISLNESMELRVVTPVFGTPAAEAGIRPGDLIREVDGDSTVGMQLSQAVERIVGERGTPVTLTIERPGEPEWIKFRIVRDTIPLHSVKGWRRTGPEEMDWDWFIDRDTRVAYIRLTQFIRGSSDDLRAALDQAMRQGARGVILDMRFNGGGLLDEAVKVANVFVDPGVIVTQEDNTGRVRSSERAMRPAMTRDLPMVVLINEASASASEIVAGALQDYGRAVLVGERTFGKGSVQNVFMLPGGSAAFKLTTQYYKLPKGRLIHRKPGANTWGVEPEVRVRVLPKMIGEALMTRQNADVVEFDAQGRLVENGDRPDPNDILEKGLDPQLETAMLLLQARIVGEQEARRAALR